MTGILCVLIEEAISNKTLYEPTTLTSPTEPSNETALGYYPSTIPNHLIVQKPTGVHQNSHLIIIHEAWDTLKLQKSSPSLSSLFFLLPSCISRILSLNCSTTTPRNGI